MPDWLTAVLTQYPVAVVIGLVAWYAHKQLRLGHLEQRKRDDENHTTPLTELKRSYEEQLRSKDAEVARVTSELGREIGELRKAVNALARKVGKQEGGS
jgi:hypothetical protein